MNIFKAMGDLKDTVVAAPGLIASAQQLQASTQASLGAVPTQAGGQAYVNALNLQTAGEPQPGNLDPIAGVGLELYTAITRGIAPFGYDASRLPEVAASHGVATADWALAEAGWGARIQTDRAVGARFNQLYTAG